MELDKRIVACKKNRYELNNFISEYKPFIANVVRKHLGKYVEYGKDDELSVGLLAFEEAIMSYSDGKGSFLSFAETVIKRRLIDYFRKESKHNNVITISSYVNEQEDYEVDITEKQSINNYTLAQENELRKYEIIEIQKELKEWDISFFELPEVSPKHEETRKIYHTIVDAIIANSQLIEMIRQKKYLPIAEIEKLTGIHRKKIERSRKYVIAVIIILTGDYKFIQSFINWR